MRVSRPACVVLWCAAMAVLAGCRASAPTRDAWTPPAAAGANLQLPRLPKPLVLDGELGEWSDTPRIAMRSPASIAGRAADREWRGPADAGLVVRCAWTQEGLCFAVVVTDDEVRNDRETARLRDQDCVEIVVDVQSLAHRSESIGFHKVLLRPPTAGRGAEVVGADPPEVAYEGLQVGAKSTAEGYAAEVLVPWKNLSGLAPRVGTELGLFFRLDEYDARDGETRQPLKMAFRGIQTLNGAAARRMARFVLAERVDDPTAQTLPLLAAVRVPRVLADPREASVELEADESLADIASLRIEVALGDGRRLLDRTLRPAGKRFDWGTRFVADLAWPADAPDGYATLRLTAGDGRGRPVGVLTEPMVIVAGGMQRALGRLEAADLPRLVQAAPFRAAAHLAVAANVERVKYAAAMDDVRTAVDAARESAARLDVLAGRPAADRRGLLSLLALTADPEGQVVVEYPPGSAASVAFLCGGLPYLGVSVEQRKDAAAALKALDEEPYLLARHTRATTVAGRPARAMDLHYAAELTTLDAVAPEREVVLVCNVPSIITVLALADLSVARVAAAAILPDCPASTREAVETWARATKTPVLPLSEATAAGRFLVAGRVRPEHVLSPGRPTFLNRMTVKRRFCRLEVADGDQVLRVECPAPAVAALAAEWVMARRRVSAADADRLRLALVKALAPPTPEAATPAAEGPAQVLSGDCHMHTFYSDGRCSPVGLMCAAIYAGLDFAVISDHNEIAGAQLAARLLSNHGVDYPVIVGEEITLSWSHVNAYPVTRFIAPAQTVEAIGSAAEAQGAVVQWNHPGFPAADFAVKQMPLGLAGTGLSAWEHYPARHDDWLKAGTLPPIVGATDTHDGTFAKPERTIICVPKASGAALASAVRRGRAVALLHGRDTLFYGPDAASIAAVWTALAQGETLRDEKAERLKAVLRNADIAGLLRASEPRPVPVEPGR
jgi:hypothetical protein